MAVTDLLPLADFDRFRAKVELLASSSLAAVTLGVRLTSDGVTFSLPFAIPGAVYLPKSATIDDPIDPPFDYLPFTGMGSPSQRWLQIGFFGRKQSGASSSSTRAIATVRLTLDFKMGDSAAPPSP